MHFLEAFTACLRFRRTLVSTTITLHKFHLISSFLFRPTLLTILIDNHTHFRDFIAKWTIKHKILHNLCIIGIPFTLFSFAFFSLPLRLLPLLPPLSLSSLLSILLDLGLVHLAAYLRHHNSVYFALLEALGAFCVVILPEPYLFDCFLTCAAVNAVAFYDAIGLTAI